MCNIIEIMDISLRLLKVCPVCNKKFTANRISQTYCNIDNFSCRTFFNNEKARLKRKAMSNVVKILDKNRSVVQKTLGDNLTITKSKEWLYGAGLDFNFITHSMKIENTTAGCIYEYALLNIGDNKIKIIKYENID